MTVAGQTYKRTAALGDGGATLVVTLPFVIDTTPPGVSSAAFDFETTPNAVRVAFDEPLKVAPTAGDFAVANVGGTATPPAFAVSYDAAARAATVRFAGVVPDGNWRLTLRKSALVDAAGNAAAGDFAFDFFALAGDATRDRRVGLADFVTLRQHYGQSGNAVFSDGDFNYDGRVGLADFVILRQHYGAFLPPPGGSLFAGGGIGGDDGDNDDAE